MVRSRERLRKKTSYDNRRFQLKLVALITICLKDVLPDSSSHIISNIIVNLSKLYYE